MSSVPTSRERAREHVAPWIEPVAIIAECHHRLKRRFEVAWFENMTGHIGVVRPSSGQEIRLKLEAN